MDKPIQVGDLVMVVRSCCDHQVRGKVVFNIPWRVSKIIASNRRCRGCGFGSATMPVALAEEPYGKKWKGKAMGAPIAFLKRIDPASELEVEKTQEGIREPA